MTTHFAKTGILCGAVLAAALAGLLSTTAAEARGGKEFFSEDYEFAQPMHGLEGQQGNYYCSYQRLPNRVCTYDSNGNEHCKVKSWTLRQYCY
jgi:hypothetical protein